MGFKELGLSENTLKALEKKGFKEPTEIQEKTIPILLNGDIDVVGQAQTGTGKTAAFGLPLIEKIDENSKDVQALILTPTRELSIQVSEEIDSLKGNKNLKILPVYGGQPIEPQIRQLKRGVHIVVGTPGRILDHIKRGSLNLKNISYLVLDEADEMLNMGFIDDVEEILRHTNKNKRVLLFSATLPRTILNLAKRYMGEYKLVSVKKETLTTNLVEQIYYEVSNSKKFDALCRVIDVEDDFYGLVFCKTRADVNEVANKLVENGYEADALHGDIAQKQRERILNKFKKKRINILVATDVAARGIDINNLTHVINYSLPQNPESYVHRIGRTGRAGKKGTAITFISPDEYRKLNYIKKIAKANIRKEKLPEKEDITNAKKSKILNKIAEIIKSENYLEYVELSQKLIEEFGAEKALAGLLKYYFKDGLNKNSIRTQKRVINTRRERKARY
ncbi:DEAD/DEAH box helicase [Methanotorris formicicus]|uniref:RNA helicase n=1 Tax=Methanotorris formicicus Mc-S-70 TaxID=647171 RepID=H1KWQ1_9EURY|nr:DEAD/DEAH box helicase [Methanotorris formicicus]EHP89166.1 DEAD/DEAH box helicase domain protein [Methanotorris formicicus Mc-S-70]